MRIFYRVTSRYLQIMLRHRPEPYRTWDIEAFISKYAPLYQRMDSIGRQSFIDTLQKGA